MKKVLFAAFLVLFLVAVAVVGMMPASEAGTVTVDELNTDGHTHVYSEIVKVNNSYHVYACECGEIDPRGNIAHTFDVWCYDDDAHWMACACGITQTEIWPTLIQPVAHSVNTEVWKAGETTHWNECVCGYHANEAAHDGEASCKAAATCSVCDKTYGGKDSTVHAMGVQWANITETTHQGIYSCCGLVVETEEHIWGDDHICDFCEYECQHVGGEANCTYQAVCEICDKPYGDTIPTAHAGGVATCLSPKICDYCSSPYGECDTENHVSAEEDYRINADDPTKHERYHVCCNIVIEITEHEGGTATCMALKVCTLCEAEYGEKDPNNHVTDCTILWELTDTPKATHKGAYILCGLIVEEADHTFENSECTACGHVCTEHEGGTATCIALPECMYCGAEYGELDANNHESTEFNYAPILNPDNSVAAQHSRTHKCCNAPAEAEDHTGGEANCLSGAICVSCGAEYTAKNAENHTEATFTYEAIPGEEGALSTQHKKIHTCCDAVAGTEDHTGGVADCEQGAICEHCGEEYTAKDAENHTETTFTYEAIPGEVGALSTQHKKIHTCCGAVAVTEDHTGGAANCTSGAICEHCGEVYTAINADVHTVTDAFNYELVIGIDSVSVQHMKFYKCCGAEAGAEDHVGGKASCTELAVCTICEKAYGTVDPNGHVEGTAATCQNAAVCQLCSQSYGEPNPEAHNWDTENWTQDATTNTHYRKCLNGDCTARNNEAACDGGKATCIAAATCEVCGNAYGTADPNGHVERTAATCMVKAQCDLCEAFYGELSTEHVWDTTTWIADDENDTHYHKCSIENCTAKGNVTACSGGTADCMNCAECEECGQPYGEKSTEHKFDDELSVDTVNNVHYYACTVTGCTERSGESAHDYTASYGSSIDGHWGVCVCGVADPDPTAVVAHVYDQTVHTDANEHWNACVCGYEEAGSRAAHTHNYTDETHDDSYHWMICDCGHVTDPEAHAHTLKGNDASTHWLSCACGHVDEDSVGNHEWVDGVCSNTNCALICAHDTADGYRYEINPDGGHDKICNECNKIVVNEAHDFAPGPNGEQHYVKDNEKHWIACICGQKQNEAEGADHVVITPANCLEPAVCEICGSFGDVDSDTHASLGESIVEIPGNLTHHAKVHECCQVLIEQLPHDYVNGVCSSCEYVCTHTGGTATCKDKAVCTACGQAYGDLSPEHKYDNDCDDKCNVCEATREITHAYGDWSVTKAATTTEKGEQKRTCSVCGAVETAEIAMLTPDPDAEKAAKEAEMKKKMTIIIVAVAAAAVVIVAIIIGVAVSKKKRAAKAAAEPPAWIKKKNRKKKWKKK